MSQSSVILAALLGGFVAYLALTGKLQTYWTLLAGGGAKPPAAGAGGSSASAGSGVDWGAIAGDLVSVFAL